MAGLVWGSRGVIAAALSQLAKARIVVPFWIPLCGAVAVCAFKALSVNRSGGNSAVVTAVSIVVLLYVFTAAFMLTKVNGVFVHVAIGIIRMLLESGQL